MGCSHSQFDPHGVCVSFASKRSSGNAVPHVLVIQSRERHKYTYLGIFSLFKMESITILVKMLI